MKICSECGKEKKLTEFYKNKSNSDGLHGMCKLCYRTYQKKYKETKPDSKAKLSNEFIFNAF